MSLERHATQQRVRARRYVETDEGNATVLVRGVEAFEKTAPGFETWRRRTGAA